MSSTLQTLDYEEKCRNCHAAKWAKTLQGDIACLNCGIKCSLGYLTFEEEVYIDAEQPNKLSRANKASAEFNYQSNSNMQHLSIQQQEKNEVHDLNSNNSDTIAAATIAEEEARKFEHMAMNYFDTCIRFFPFNMKEMFLEKENFEKEFKSRFIVQTQKYIQQFVYSYFLNLFVSLFGIEQGDYYQIELKSQLEMKEDQEVKVLSVNNQPQGEELFIYLMQQLYPSISESDYSMCLLRLDQIQEQSNAIKSTKICVAAYDLLLNYFKMNKIIIEDIIEKASKVYAWQQKGIKSATVKRNYKIINEKENDKIFV